MQFPLFEKNIDSVRKSFPPAIFERHQAVLKMGEEVNELKKEVFFLRDSLQNSLSHQDILKRCISYFEQRKEAELIRQSREFEEENRTITGKSTMIVTHCALICLIVFFLLTLTVNKS